MNRVLWVDGVKAIGCLIVFLSHFNKHFHLNEIFPFPLSNFELIYNGHWAVHVFIILSGFSITIPLYSFVKCNCHYVYRFVLKRYLRLALPIAFASIFGYLLSLTPFYYDIDTSVQDNFLRERSLTIKLLIREMFMAPISSVGLESTVLWMMLVLFRGAVYIIVQYWMLSLCKLERFLPYTMFFSMVYCITMDYTLYASLYFGALLPIMIRYISRLQFNGLTSFLIGTILIFCGVVIEELLIKDKSNFYSAIMIILGLAFNTKIQKVIQCNSLMKLANISFALYLLHCYILDSVSTFLFVSTVGFPGKIIFIFIVTYISVLVCSNLFHSYVEKNICNQICSYILKKL